MLMMTMGEHTTTTTKRGLFFVVFVVFAAGPSRGLVIPPRSVAKFEATPPAQTLPEKFNDFDCVSVEGCAVDDDAAHPHVDTDAAVSAEKEADAKYDAVLEAMWSSDASDEAVLGERAAEAAREMFSASSEDEDDSDAFPVPFAQILASDDERDVWRRLELASLAGTPGERPSHELVDVDDAGRPKYLGAGDFAFVDEALCNGCALCSAIAPATFFAEPARGKGRAFRQGGDAAEAIDEAVFACPRRAIKRLSFADLKAFETARDAGVKELPQKAPVDAQAEARDARARAAALAVARRAVFADRHTVDL